MSQEQRKTLLIVLVAVLGAIALMHLIYSEQWAELVTALLGVAGFLLTWDVTEKKADD